MLIKVNGGYTYKGFYITKAKKASVTGFSCSHIQTIYPLKLKEIIARIDQLEAK